MTKCITIEYPDGSIAIRGGIGSWMLARFGGDEDAARQFILDELVPVQNPGGVARIEDITFPPDKEFRDAWRRGGGAIEIDMPAARAIHAGRMARARGVELARLEAEEPKERLLGNIAKAAQLTADLRALEALELSALATAIQAAQNTAALTEVWPARVPR